MFLIISWVITGAILGSVGVAGVASFIARGSPRGDPDLDTIFFFLFLTTAVGTVGGGIVARAVRRKFAGNPRKLDQLALLPLLAAAVLVGYAALKP
jgi:hypothetical protein